MPAWCSCNLGGECERAIELCGAVPECSDCRADMEGHVCWRVQELLENSFTPVAPSQSKYIIQAHYGATWELAEDLHTRLIYSLTFTDAKERLEAILGRKDGVLYRIVNRRTGLEVEFTPDDELPPGLERKRMVNVKFLRENGRLMISVDATSLHETLDSIGVQTEGEPVRYKDRPYATEAVVNTTSLSLSTEVFLVKSYPAKFDLTAVFTKPPSVESLKKVAQSAYEQVRKILEHYQPIDIQVEIQKKVLKEAPNAG